MSNNGVTRRRFDFLTPEKSEQYLIFLKEHVYNTKPIMLAAIKHEVLQSSEGEMVEVIFCNEIENPNHEIIALCTINNAPIMVWNDKVYTIALGAAGRPAMWYEDSRAGLDWRNLVDLWDSIPVLRMVRMVIHEIVEPVIEDDRILESE
jgi:hypothetical protein